MLTGWLVGCERLGSADNEPDNSTSSFLLLTVNSVQIYTHWCQYEIGAIREYSFTKSTRQKMLHCIKRNSSPIYIFSQIAFLSRIKVEIWNFHEALNCAGMHWLHIFELHCLHIVELGIWRNLTMYISQKSSGPFRLLCTQFQVLVLVLVWGNTSIFLKPVYPGWVNQRYSER